MAFTMGETRFWGATFAPDRWLICDGTAISRTTYAQLFALLGVAFGAGDGVTTFNLPDLRNRMWAFVGSVIALAANEGLAEAARAPTQHQNTGGATQQTNIALDHVQNGLAGPPSAESQTATLGVGPRIPMPGHTHDNPQWFPPADHPYDHWHGQGGTVALDNWPPSVAFNQILYAGV